MPSVAEIFRLYGEAYREKYGSQMPADQLKTMSAIENCRTGKLGVAIYTCQECGEDHTIARSCANRHCPTCQADKGKKWLEKQLDRLLPCPYFFLCFTVPDAARMIMRSHPRECYNILMEAAARTLMALAKNPKYVGSSRLSMTSVLHTWGRDLSYNPHVHVVVAGGGLSRDGTKWLPSHPAFFVPVFALSVVFRAKVRDALKEAGLLDKFPPEVWKQEWVVHSKPVGDGRGAMKYLAPYIFRVAINDGRIQKIEPGPDGKGRVTYSYLPVDAKKSKTLPVSAEEFIRRFLQHVLPSGFRKVRNYGHGSSRSRMKLELMKWLVTVTLNMVYTLTVTASVPAPKSTPRCSHCGGALILVGIVFDNVTKLDTS